MDKEDNNNNYHNNNNGDSRNVHNVLRLQQKPLTTTTTPTPSKDAPEKSSLKLSVQQIELPTHIHDMLQKRRQSKQHHKHHPHHRTHGGSSNGSEAINSPTERSGVENRKPPKILMSTTGDLVEASKDAATAIFYPLSPSHPPHESKEKDEYEILKRRIIEALPEVPIKQVDSSKNIEELLSEELAKGKDSAFYLINLSTLIMKYQNWKKYLPRVHPFYAMKCNPDKNIVKTLVTCGVGLDCASKKELKLGIRCGCPPQNIIFANPAKAIEHIEYARDSGVKMMTFDNESELKKVHQIYPCAQMVLRILGDDSHSLAPLGSKFGANVDTEVPHLLQVAKELKINLIGVSFHVGSGCQCADAYLNTLKLARRVFDEAEALGFDMTLLDIGGGWPGVEAGNVNFHEIAQVVGPAIDQHFDKNKVRVISEPGRYFATECVTLAANIVSKRERPNPSNPSKPIVQYYLSDGVYGSFNNVLLDHAHPEPHLLHKKSSTPSYSTSVGQAQEPLESATLFGPTCDSLDVICTDAQLPKLDVGDWLFFSNMGAYTMACATHFNGFLPPNATYFLHRQQQ